MTTSPRRRKKETRPVGRLLPRRTGCCDLPASGRPRRKTHASTTQLCYKPLFFTIILFKIRTIILFKIKIFSLKLPLSAWNLFEFFGTHIFLWTKKNIGEKKTFTRRVHQCDQHALEYPHMQGVYVMCEITLWWYMFLHYFCIVFFFWTAWTLWSSHYVKRLVGHFRQCGVWRSCARPRTAFLESKTPVKEEQFVFYCLKKDFPK